MQVATSQLLLTPMKQAAGDDLNMAPSTKMPSAVDGIGGVGESFDYPIAHTPEGPYTVLKDQYHSKPRKLRVACVGAGASGLCLAYKMEKMMVPGSWELTLFEKNKQFGGTWYENTYPGVVSLFSQQLSFNILNLLDLQNLGM